MKSKREIYEHLPDCQRKVFRYMCVAWAVQNLGWTFTQDREDQFVEAVVSALDEGGIILCVDGGPEDMNWGFEMTKKGERMFAQLQAILN